jgi:hypothetical protein
MANSMSLVGAYLCLAAIHSKIHPHWGSMDTALRNPKAEALGNRSLAAFPCV